MSKDLQQVVAPKWPQGDPVHEMLSWEQSQEILRDDLKWRVHPKRYQDKMQEQYAQTMGIHTPSMQMSDVYSLWSAITTIQLLSAHTRDTKVYQKYLGVGQKARFWYAPRPKKEKEDTYVDSDLGVLTELHKQYVAMHKWMRKPTIGMNEMQKVQHQEHKAKLVSEVERLIYKTPCTWKNGH